VEFHNFIEEIAFCTSLGLGTLALAILAIGLLGGLNRVGFGAVILALLSCSVVEMRRKRPQGPRRREGIGSFNVVVLALVGATFILLLGGSLAPPIGSDWDSLSYHLAVPKIYLADGRIHYIPFTHQSNFPFTMEMLYTLGLFLNGSSLAKLNHLLALGLTLFLILGVGKRLWGKGAGEVAAACYISAPIVILEATTAYIDLGYALFYLLAAAAFLVWWLEGKRNWLVLSGICCGFCMGTKMTGVLAFVSLAVLLTYRVIRAKGGWREFAGFLLPALLIASPWYLKSLIWTGNPVFPFFYNIFGGTNWDGTMAAAYRFEQQKFGVGTGMLQLIRLPIDLCFRHERFIDLGYARQLSSPGILWLCFLPPLLFLRKHDRAFKITLALAGLGALGWFYSMQQVRYFIPILALLSLATGHATQRISSERILRWLLRGIVITVLALGITFSGSLTAISWKVVLGFEGQREYLKKYFDRYQAFEYINESTLPGSKVVTFGEPRGFYCDKPYFWGDPNHNKIIDREKGTTASGLVSELRRLHVTHVLIPKGWLASEDRELEELNVPQFREALREAARTRLLRPVFDDEKTIVLRVEGKDEGG
jgi:hypothetical protein